MWLLPWYLSMNKRFWQAIHSILNLGVRRICIWYQSIAFKLALFIVQMMEESLTLFTKWLDCIYRRVNDGPSRPKWRGKLSRRPKRQPWKFVRQGIIYIIRFTISISFDALPTQLKSAHSSRCVPRWSFTIASVVNSALLMSVTIVKWVGWWWFWSNITFSPFCREANLLFSLFG